MRKIGIVLLVMGIGVLIYQFFMFIDADKQTFREECDRQNEIKSHVGEEVIIGKDTSVITDIDFWNTNYILRNGETVDFSFVKHQKKYE